MERSANITIIGGGVVGCAIAYELSQAGHSGITVLERNETIHGVNQSLRNAGVIHADIYYPSDTEPLKAALCVKGNRLLYDFCHSHRIPHRRVGKLVIATNGDQEEYLDDVFQIAKANGVPNVRKVSGTKVRTIEPNVTASAALFVPTSGIVHTAELLNTMHRLAKAQGVSFFFGSQVVGIRPSREGTIITVRSTRSTHDLSTRILINAAGLYSDEIAKMVNPRSLYEIEPARGELAQFQKTKRKDIWISGMNLYQTPYGYWHESGERASVGLKEFKRLVREGRIVRTVGVHLTPTVQKGSYSTLGETVLVGPVRTVGLGKEEYIMGKKPGRAYLESVQHFFPNLDDEDIKPYTTGIMAVLKNHPDFVIERDAKFPQCINLIGIDSPGLTASLSIAEYVRVLVKSF